MFNLLGKIKSKMKKMYQLKHGHIIKRPKKGDLGDCKILRGITLLSVPSKNPKCNPEKN